MIFYLEFKNKNKSLSMKIKRRARKNGCQIFNNTNKLVSFLEMMVANLIVKKPTRFQKLLKKT